MSRYEKPRDLKERVRSGRGDRAVYRLSGDIISIETAFAGTNPRPVRQDKQSGVNNIESAAASKVTWTIKPDWLYGIDDRWVEDFAKMLEAKVIEYNAAS